MTQEDHWAWIDCDSKSEQDRYINDLLPDREVFKGHKSALGQIVHVIHTHLSNTNNNLCQQAAIIKVQYIKTCGSVGKHTDSSKSSDLDLVVHIQDLDPQQDLSKRTSEILGEIQMALDKEYPGTRDTSWHRTFGLQYVIEGMEIDIFIGCTNIKPKDFLQVESRRQRSYMAASVFRYATYFMKKQGVVFKDLVRIVKDWRDSYYPSWPPQCKPESYLIEVLLLHTCRQALPRIFNEKRNSVCWSIPSTPNLISFLLLHFFQMVGQVELYQKGQKYTKDNMSLSIVFDTYYQQADIPWNEPDPLFRRPNKTDKKQKNSAKPAAKKHINSRHATALVLDPVNPTNNLWLSLADASIFINRAKSTAKILRNHNNNNSKNSKDCVAVNNHNRNSKDWVAVSNHNKNSHDCVAVKNHNKNSNDCVAVSNHNKTSKDCVAVKIYKLRDAIEVQVSS
ncbi:2'-5'-oligoadenylate [Seminavis robusta]|uniref:2'-5'-oligoadenylate n=1 Tax=Seminavis robusta TaxID=568900 RepID=A0A9N8HMZ6_9STRA|nr:2'-5'-oligoadenylate [Seminavis robusta]|eukprot:Sro1041_g234580.1 2'-5'-oligoadenylate (451) ;mRNA; f:22844-24196